MSDGFMAELRGTRAQRRWRASSATDVGAAMRRAAASGSLFLAIAVAVALVALVLRIGADSQWLSALGRTIAARGSIPAGVPFAAASSAHWHNPLVLAELVFYALQGGLGDRGLMVAQLIAVALALTVAARDALAAGADSEGTARVILLAALAGASSLVIARVQLFSLALFPVVLLLLRSDYRRPSRRVLLVVGLLAVWANLHGAVLIGLFVALVYLAFGNPRRVLRARIALGAACIVAVFVNPAPLHTVSYFHGVLTNVAAERGVGLWARVSIANPLDDLTLVVLAVLCRLALRARVARWEALAVVGLAVLGAGASRSLVWIVLLLIAPASRGVRARSRQWGFLLPLVCAAAVVATGIAIARGPVASAVDDGLVARAITLAHGTPILAPDLLGERVVLRGGRIWVGNPFDAFSHREQRTFLDWIEGRASGTRALALPVRVALASKGSGAARLLEHASAYELVASDKSTLMFERRF
jgi:hypothetical protein